MQIERYGIILTRLREEHIEEVRKHRNDPSIRNFMEYREFITPEMQKKWFNSLDDLRDFYFVIEYKNEMVGLIHTSGIDWIKKTGNAGLFIWAQKYLSTHVPVLASLSMVDFFFCYCKLENMFAKVMSSNAVAINYNSKLGFVPFKYGQKNEFPEYVLEKNNYFKTTAKLQEMAGKLPDKKYEINIERDLFDLLKKANALIPGAAIKERGVIFV